MPKQLHGSIFLLVIVALFVGAAAHADGRQHSALDDTLFVMAGSQPGIPLTLDLTNQRHHAFLLRQLDEAGLFAGDSRRDLAAFMKSAPESRFDAEHGLTLLQMDPIPYGEWRTGAMITQLSELDDGRFVAAARLAMTRPLHGLLLLRIFDTSGEVWRPITDLSVVDSWYEANLKITAEGSAAARRVTAVYTYLYHLGEWSEPVAGVIFKTLDVATASPAERASARGEAPAPVQVASLSAALGARHAADLLPLLAITGSTSFSGINPTRPSDSSCTTDDDTVDCIRLCTSRNNCGSGGGSCDYQSDGTCTDPTFDISGTLTLASGTITIDTGSTYPIYATNPGLVLSGDSGSCQDDIGDLCTFAEGGTLYWGPNVPDDEDGTTADGTQCCNTDGSNGCLEITEVSTSGGCFDSGDNYNVDIDLTLDFEVDSDGQSLSVQNTEDSCTASDTDPYTDCQDVVRIVAGCLAADTPILMADGTLKEAEKIVVGEKVLADREGRTLTVFDTFIGDEKEPLVVIEDSAGNTLRMTDNHPVVTPGDGIKLAKLLQVGDRLVTPEGTASITAISHQQTTAKVYNFSLGAPGEKFAKDDTTLFAAGILVGDNQMQTSHEEAYHTSGAAIGEVPEAWRGDYQQWVEQQAAGRSR